MTNKIWTAEQGEDKVIAVRSPYEYREMLARAGDGVWSPANGVWIFDATPQKALDICNCLGLRRQNGDEFQLSESYLRLLSKANEKASQTLAGK